ncbi:hypothetical protein [Paraburkholderia strydomiana]|uniref:hypothetical protein n=1 Tax=Paraburkholderia strydomiana TaxID=1245417 RepID=UPI001BEC49C0|nr:hypothetical protein [Paraburkholderia strydomiana]MBT2794469.1 hypothetical protein [Paraburkholderia strydomiana]
MNPTRHPKLSLIAAMMAIAVAAGTARAAESAPDAASEAELDLTKETAHPVADLPAGLGNFCFFARLPPASQKYKVIKNVKIGKGTYGGVADILPKMAEYAQLRGADAIVEYSGSQRFGFWPWRMVRPVVRGVAVQWTEPRQADCESIGGTKLSTILSSGQPPAK